MPKLTLSHGRVAIQHHISQPSNPTLLLLHGAGGSHRDWPPALRTLPDANVIAIDLPGHGNDASDDPPLTSAEAMADCVQELADQLSLEKGVVAGHSMGGAIALTLALRQPSFLHGLVLVSTAARLKVAPSLLTVTPSEMDSAVAFIRRHAWSATTPPDLMDAVEQRLRATPSAVMQADFRATNAYDVRSRLSEIALPTLVVHGGDDRMVPLAFGASLADQLPRATFHALPAIGHYAPLEAPLAVASAVADFLTTLG